jgi:hypothetical protein
VAASRGAFCTESLPIARLNLRVDPAYDRSLIDRMTVGKSSMIPRRTGFENRHHVIAINERQLRRVIRSYVDYYHADRTHLGLEKDAPEERPIEPREIGAVVAFSRVGGRHHRHTRELQRAA